MTTEHISRYEANLRIKKQQQEAAILHANTYICSLLPETSIASLMFKRDEGMRKCLSEIPPMNRPYIIRLLGVLARKGKTTLGEARTFCEEIMDPKTEKIPGLVNMKEHINLLVQPCEVKGSVNPCQ